MIDLFNYQRRASSVVHVGAIDMGGDNPIRIQSMTTTNTNDTDACVKQAERIIKAGGELVRLTTQVRGKLKILRTSTHNCAETATLHHWLPTFISTHTWQT